MRLTDWLPYFGPMLAFLAVLSAAEHAPPGLEAALLAARVLVPGLVFLYYFRAGAYPELRGFSPGGGVILDVLVGLSVAAVWVAPYLVWPELRPGSEEAFNPNAAGAENRLLLIGLRLAGFALVTPFIEELFVRSFLIRLVEVIRDEEPDFRRIPIGHFAWSGFLFTVGWFTFTHTEWEWPVAFMAGVIYNLWLYQRKHIGSLILAHAVTNAALLFFVVSREDLWFFL